MICVNIFAEEKWHWHYLLVYYTTYPFYRHLWLLNLRCLCKISIHMGNDLLNFLFILKDKYLKLVVIPIDLIRTALNIDKFYS